MKARLLLSIPFIALAILLFFKASTISFTHDEALSYQIIHGNEGLKLTANHHLLNTWLMHIFSVIFGDQEISLRMPNILAFVLYLFVVFKLISRSHVLIGAFAGIPILLLNTYLLDFFCLARGYGLSTGFMMTSVYFLLSRRHNNSLSMGSFFWTIFFAAMSVLANFNLLNFFIAINLICFIRSSGSFGTKKQIIFLIGITLLTLVFIGFSIQRLLLLKQGNELYYGSERFDEGLSSLVLWSFNFSYWPVQGPIIVEWTIKVLFVFIAAYLLYKRKFSSPAFILFALMSLIMAAQITERYLFDALYPFARTALFMVPLFGLLVVLVLKDICEQFSEIKYGILTALIFLLFFVPVSYHFVCNFNFRMVTEWVYDANTKQAVNWINERYPEGLRMQSNWVFDPAIQYYVNSRKLKIKSARRNETMDESTQIVYDYRDFSQPGFILIKDFEDTGTAIFERQR